MKDEKAPGVIQDPELYKRLLSPFPSKKSADDAAQEFYKEFRVLREKYCIPDIALVVRQIYKDPSGEKDRDELMVMNCGDSSLTSTMLAVGAMSQIRDKAHVEIPPEIFDREDFYTGLILHLKIASTESEAREMIRNGEVRINGIPIIEDEYSPDYTSKVEIRGYNILVPGIQDINFEK